MAQMAARDQHLRLRKCDQPGAIAGTVDCLIVMEKSEVLRPDFLEMLKPADGPAGEHQNHPAWPARRTVSDR